MSFEPRVNEPYALLDERDAPIAVITKVSQLLAKISLGNDDQNTILLNKPAVEMLADDLASLVHFMEDDPSAECGAIYDPATLKSWWK